jgi:hypothetical protein
MATATGANGCIFDTDATQPTGALSTGIGFGTNSVMGPPDTKNFTALAVPALSRIGGAAGAFASIVAPAKTLKVEQNPGPSAIAIGGAFADTFINQTGVAIPANGYCVATSP